MVDKRLTLHNYPDTNVRAGHVALVTSTLRTVSRGLLYANTILPLPNTDGGSRWSNGPAGSHAVHSPSGICPGRCASCASGGAVPDAANNPGLVSDCEALLLASLGYLSGQLLR